ncbi:hypothetical protein DM01DRAFT_1375399 [Hesseltinella vesiculosa]|uniref:Uncharacterized protein n=1 Tax=Hesseltinella vesiculosa TaxID=101127 RepID=A0A1X2GE63_9FUNG|nr:hypothetical protein DM01DRAFT_1375399 [Hesseltinella vesiculosa]
MNMETDQYTTHIVIRPLPRRLQQQLTLDDYVQVQSLVEYTLDQQQKTTSDNTLAQQRLLHALHLIRMLKLEYRRQRACQVDRIFRHHQQQCHTIDRVCMISAWEQRRAQHAFNTFVEQHRQSLSDATPQAIAHESKRVQLSNQQHAVSSGEVDAHITTPPQVERSEQAQPLPVTDQAADDEYDDYQSEQLGDFLRTIFDRQNEHAQQEQAEELYEPIYRQATPHQADDDRKTLEDILPLLHDVPRESANGIGNVATEDANASTAEAKKGEEAERKRRLHEQQESDRQRRLLEQQEAERQHRFQEQQEAQRQRQLQEEAERQSRLQEKQEAERLRQIKEEQEAKHQRRMQQQQEEERQSRLQAERLRQIKEEQEAERQRQFQEQQEAERQRQMQRQQEAERQRLIQEQQEAEHRRQVEEQHEADRQRRLHEKKEAERHRRFQEQQDAELQRQLQQEKAAAMGEDSDDDGPYLPDHVLSLEDMLKNLAEDPSPIPKSAHPNHAKPSSAHKKEDTCPTPPVVPPPKSAQDQPNDQRVVELNKIEQQLDRLERETHQLALQTPLEFQVNDQGHLFLDGNTHNNRLFLKYEDDITRLMLQLDNILSDGNPVIRTRRRTIVQKAEHLLDQLDRHRQQEWEKETRRQAALKESMGGAMNHQKLAKTPLGKKHRQKKRKQRVPITA